MKPVPGEGETELLRGGEVLGLEEGRQDRLVKLNTLVAAVIDELKNMRSLLIIREIDLEDLPTDLDLNDTV